MGEPTSKAIKRLGVSNATWYYWKSQLQREKANAEMREASTPREAKPPEPTTTQIVDMRAVNDLAKLRDQYEALRAEYMAARTENERLEKRCKKLLALLLEEDG